MSVRFRSSLGAAAAAALSTVLLLSGCAGSTSATGEQEAPASEDIGLLPTGEGVTQYPLTLTSWAGESELPQRPERVAVIGLSPNVDALQALNVTPVYSIGEDAEWGWRDQQWLSGIELLDTATRRDPINYEGIASTSPDLIIAANYVTDEADYEKLSGIAPVLEVAEQPGGDNPIDWRETQRLIGQTLDLGSAAEQVIIDSDAAVDEIAQANRDLAGQTITLAYDYGEEYGIDYYTTTGGTAEQFMLELGFAPNPLAENFVDDATVPDENQAMLDADILVMIYSDQPGREARESQELFSNLGAVKDDNYVSLTFNEAGNVITADGRELPNAVWMLRGGTSPLSRPWAAEVILDQWLADVNLS